MALISFITPVYNEENYLPSLFKNIDNDYEKFDFEWIFIDDGSNDNSFELIKNFSNNKDKIKLIKNSGKGKIDAINCGFLISKGKFIKLVGGDDEIDLSFIDRFKNYEDGYSYVHFAKIVNEKNEFLGNYVPSYQLFNYNLEKYLLNNISCPSWCWIFPKEVGDHFFPLPEIEYEDLYLSFCIKKFSKIKILNENFYKYRQNPGQTFGNILKFDNEIGRFRNLRSLRSLSVLKNFNIFSAREKFLLSSSRLYFILYLKKKNLITIFTSKLPFQRKIKLVVFRYLFKFYGNIQKLKYLFDKFYLYFNKFKKQKKIVLNKSIIDYEKGFNFIEDKKLILLKSCLSYPSKDGLTNQYYSFLKYVCSNNEFKAYLFCKKDFDQKDFLIDHPQKNNIDFVKNYPGTFPIFIMKMILSVFLHKIGFKNKIFSELEEYSIKDNFNFFFHDISFYPLLFLKIDPKKIIFSITDFQTNRLFKLLLINKTSIKSIYYFFGFLHCLIIESFIFKKIKSLHMYSSEDEGLMKRFFKYNNITSIPNFNENRIYTDNNNSKRFESSEKILLMGDFNQIELFNGLKKFKKLKYFDKFEKNFTFIFKGNYDAKLIKQISNGISNCIFDNKWIEKDIYHEYLDSFQILLFLDSVDFGLSNRVTDALQTKSLIAGFKTAFTGFPVKNFKEVIFIENFFDLVHAYNLKPNDRSEIINNANLLSNEYKLDLVKSKWNKIL